MSDNVMTTYEMCKILITNNKYEKEDMTQKLDIFLLGNRVTQEEYIELIGLMNPLIIKEVK